MIDEEMTVRMFSYTSDMLAWKSHKKIVVMCDKCGEHRLIENRHSFQDICIGCLARGRKHSEETKKKMRGRKISEETRRKLSYNARHRTKEHQEKLNKHCIGNKYGLGRECSKETRKKIGDKQRGENNHNFGKKASDETLKLMSDVQKGHIVTKETKQKISKNNNKYWLGKFPTEETRKRLSATHQGIPYDEWESFAKEQLYCPKFNESCRESNREKYGRRCFVCGKPESENITTTGRQRKLSVHHCDMDKEQGCNGVRWKLVPLCLKHHGIAHNELWSARIVWLLNNVW